MSLPRCWKSWTLLLVILAAVVFTIRITGTGDLEDNSQSRNVGYAIDLVKNGDWLVQYDLQGRILSKPPLHTWLVGLFAVPFGLNRVTLALPSFLAVVAMTLLVFDIGRRRFGLLAGGLAGLAVIMTPLLGRQIGMVRSDALFALAITGGAWAAFRAWETGRGWILFWVCGAVAVLTKGPLGLVLSSAGLLAWLWENRTHGPALKPRGGHLWGIVIFLGICLAWIVPALWFHGRPLVDKMIFEELLGHVASADNGKVEGNLALRLFKPTLNFLSRFAPFSLFACYGLYRVFRRPAVDAGERRFERYLACWVLAGMVIFTVVAHHRADLLLPLWPAGALLAGREGDRLYSKIGPGKLAWGATVVSLLLLVGAWLNYHPVGGRNLKSSAYSETVRQAAVAFRATGIDPKRLHYMDTPTTFQYHLGTAKRWEEPAAILADRPGHDRMLVATGGEVIEPATFAMADVSEVFRWPVDHGEEPVVRVYELRWR